MSQLYDFVIVLGLARAFACYCLFLIVGLKQIRKGFAFGYFLEASPICCI